MFYKDTTGGWQTLKCQWFATAHGPHEISDILNFYGVYFMKLYLFRSLFENKRGKSFNKIYYVAKSNNNSDDSWSLILKKFFIILKKHVLTPFEFHIVTVGEAPFYQNWDYVSCVKTFVLYTRNVSWLAFSCFTVILP